MRFITKIYKYDSSKSDYRGEDFSKYMLIGDSDTDNLDDTLDTYELTLAGLNFREEFAPTTKFIIEKYQDTVSIENLIKTYNFIVKDDSVSQPIISDDTYFDHHLTLIEAGAEAQNRLVDNIAVTYKLQDVSLDLLPTFDTTNKVNPAVTNAYVATTDENYGQNGGLGWRQYLLGHRFEWVFPTWYNVTLTNATYNSDGELITDGNGESVMDTTSAHNPTLQDWKNLLYNLQVGTGENDSYCELPVPMLRCYAPTLRSKNLNRLNGYCPYYLSVSRYDANTNVLETTDTYDILPNSNDATETVWTADEENPLAGEMSLTTNIRGAIVSRAFVSSTDYQSISGITKWTTTYNGILVSSSTPFTTLLNRVLHITIEPDKIYKIKMWRHSYSKESWGGLGSYVNYDEYPMLYANSYKVWFESGDNFIPVSSQNLLFTAQFQVYKQTTKGVIVFQQSPPANAYDLFNKCQIASKIIEKQPNVIIDETPKAFYLSDENKVKLQNTTIVENFYNQKNLWQLFMDIGKYIHARPYIVFGDDDNFRVDWKQYGLTNQKENLGYPVSVYNSRFIEEYISSLSSYVSNMVQLGGTITEFVAPKSSSDDYLVYNDVAELIVSKPIIEIVKVFVTDNNGQKRCLASNDPADRTHGERESGYIFEQGIYNCLDVVNTVNINKGNSIYYKLGTNKIVGLNYRLPTPNNNAEYAIKVILGEVFGIGNPEHIKVNDYTFEIVYRTKDTLRADQTRPDLRDYLISNKFDDVPIHAQFNNQQDIVVDSAKFGTNMYGKLIRTGNTVYTLVEWVDDLTKLKHSGELYNIFGNLYYVSKVKNTYYTNHAISEVEFTKDFNRLSQIIGIPSEPRFYEISEQSIIDREIALNDYLYINTKDFVSQETPRTYIKDDGKTYLDNLLFGATSDYPKYAITIFKGDVDKNNTYKKNVISPLSTYSIGTSLTMEYDMVDNFSAGDQIDTSVAGTIDNKPVDGAYYALRPYQYCDKYGRADLMDFAIINDVAGLTQTQIRAFPECPISEENIDPLFGNHEMGEYGSNADGIGLLKDNREVIKVNYNIQLITDSDRFVISPYIWQQDKGAVKLALFTEETNKLSNSTIIFENNTVKYDNIAVSTSINANGNIEIDINGALTAKCTELGITMTELLADVKSIVLYSNNPINQNEQSTERYFILARNIGNLEENEIFSEIPDEYQEVEYVESSGTQYIDTGIKLSSADTVKAKFEITSKPTDYSYREGIYGTMETIGGNNTFFTLLMRSPTLARVGTSSNQVTSTNVALNTLYDTTLSNGTYIENGITYTFTPNNGFTFTTNCHLFKRNQSAMLPTSAKVYSFKIVGKFNGIPCYRKSDGVIGFYDTITNTFFTNAGTGTFTKGNDVNNININNSISNWYFSIPDKTLFPTNKPEASE